MALRRGQGIDRHNAERVITEYGGDDGGRAAAGGESTFRNGGEGAVARVDHVV